MTKKGVTMSLLIVIVIVLGILSTTIVTSVSNSINSSKLSVWTQEIAYVQDIINENKNDQEKVLLDEIEFDTSNVKSSALTEQFSGETVTDSIIMLYEVSLAKLGINNAVYGIHDSENDVYAYSKTTGRVYYLKGISGSGRKVYYTLTDELKNKYAEQEEINKNLSTIVFKASSVTYTNNPITVTVNVPKSYTDIVATTSNENVQVGAQEVKEDKYVYQVNTSNYAGNYDITVTYNDGTENKISTYSVSIYDNVEPVISYISRIGSKISIKATDELSGIKQIRYTIGEMPKEDVQQYFSTNGIKVTTQDFKTVSGKVKVALYVEDNAGNYYTTSVAEVPAWELEKTTANNKVTSAVIKKGTQTFDVGTTINYMPDGVGPTSYVGGWKILGVDKQGRVLILSNESITGKDVPLSGRNAYTNMKSILDTACANYIDGTLGVGARSITLEDLDALTDYTKKVGTPITMGGYGMEVSYYWDGTEYPKYSYGNGPTTGNLTTSHANGFTYYNEDTKEWITVPYTTTPGHIVTVKSTGGSYTGSNYINSNLLAYKMIFKNVDDSDYATRYWVVGEGLDNGAIFGIYYRGMTIYQGRYSGYMIYSSSGSSMGPSHPIRAVVTLADDVELEYNSSTGMVDIK